MNRRSRVACGAKVDQLDGRRLQVLEQDVLGFQVAVADAHVREQREHLEQLLAKVTYERGGEADALVLLEKLEQVDAERLEEQAQMALEDKMVVQLHHERARVEGLAADHAGRLLLFLHFLCVGLGRQPEALQQLYLGLCLPPEGAAVADDLERKDRPVDHVLHLQHLPECACEQEPTESRGWG